MTRQYQWLCLCLCICLLTMVRKIEGSKTVRLTHFKNAKSRGAVCLDGSEPGYFFDKGQGEGVNNWVIFVEGGAWCQDAPACIKRGHENLGSSESSKGRDQVIPFGDMRSDDPKENPEFYNWNRMHVIYCDGSSFTSDKEGIDAETNMTFRGARIYNLLIEELQAMGMSNAKNVVFAGSSAGGLTVILHCDHFRSHFSKVPRLKCLADSSYFIHDEKLEGSNTFQASFEYLVNSLGSAKSLPSNCTSKMPPSQCFYPPNSLQYMQTPIFLTMSAFDQIQIQFGLKTKYGRCLRTNTCIPEQLKTIQDLRSSFINLLPKTNSPSIAIWVNNCISHEFTLSSWYGPDKMKVRGNQTYAEVFADWFFDRSTNQVRIIAESNQPIDCSKFGQPPRLL